jgi:glycosyltransferase involved in cell wall biosynthesis
MSQVHLWAPEIFSTAGGIQAFSGNVLAALTATLHPLEIRLLLKNDLPSACAERHELSAVDGYGDWPRGLKNFAFASACLRHAFLDRPRVIVATHVNFGPIAKMIRQLTRVPYVLVAHGIDVWQLSSPAVKRALYTADKVLAVSRYTRDRLSAETGIRPDHIELLPNAVSSERFTIGPKPRRLLEQLRLEAETPVILTVCRLAAAERYKGYDQIIKALPKILSAVPNAHYVLVGSGPDRPRVEKLIRESGLQSNITLTGYVADEELADYYNLCDIFAMPSKAEGFGIVYLEALACGKPVLAGNRDGSRDALVDGELGLLVDADDIDEIAGEIIRVLRREHSHPKIFQAELLRRRVTELYGTERFQRTVAERVKPYLAS